MVSYQISSNRETGLQRIKAPRTLPSTADRPTGEPTRAGLLRPRAGVTSHPPRTERRVSAAQQPGTRTGKTDRHPGGRGAPGGRDPGRGRPRTSRGTKGTGMVKRTEKWEVGVNWERGPRRAWAARSRPPESEQRGRFRRRQARGWGMKSGKESSSRGAAAGTGPTPAEPRYLTICRAAAGTGPGFRPPPPPG